MIPRLPTRPRVPTRGILSLGVLALGVLTLAAGLLLGPVALAMPDTPANRRAEAERYERAVPVSRVLEASITQVAVLLPPEHRAGFAEKARREIDQDALRAVMLTALSETFTADELAAMTAFFGSEVGRSVSAKMTRYMHQVMPLVLGEVQAAATRYAQEHAAPR
ncbi:DUF2059 domain-containing protein [Roseospira visakhapatnamensis]|uniref:DUF2059 domain-containing protein n=1 Tax=Roseospira visakhapatnamensis TaxID=390880 RepID=A0A7W6WBD2_9PROT|nr:DUF2059 domain-containing protein [Roseospira visakhapatnamensis]MBB4267381.1 hypothetical protein [Roseospira visakhapatnamensis]